MGLLRRLIRRLRHDAAEAERVDHVTGRAHLVFEDGSVIEAEVDPAIQAQLDYLARRVVAPPPPDA